MNEVIKKKNESDTKEENKWKLSGRKVGEEKWNVQEKSKKRTFKRKNRESREKKNRGKSNISRWNEGKWIKMIRENRRKKEKLEEERNENTLTEEIR